MRFINKCTIFDRALWDYSWYTTSCLTTLIQKISKCYREPQYNKLWRQLVALATKYGVKSEDYLRRRVDDAWTLVWLGWTWLMDRVEGKMTGLLNGCWRNKGFPYFVHNTFSKDMVIVMFARWYQIKTAFKLDLNETRTFLLLFLSRGFF